ncbi:MAG: hypothetical protein OEV61_09540 [Chloroflexota bacterium]|nr:hypothetical protein [Chloroflexota bacterium]MDH5244754.1 hypothetical protein [Chloroflexota bacterium]
MTDVDRLEVQLLSEQLARMRGMLFGYSDLFFRRIRDWAIVTIALLVLASSGAFPTAVAFVPFIVPFAFLETAYLFFYTVFARRYAERLERRINTVTGVEALVAHRLEAAYFYPPDAPKIAALSAGHPLGMVSVSTIGYTLGAGILWAAGFSGLVAFAEGQGGLTGLLPAGAVLWTTTIAGYLVWSFLTRHDEARLLRELDRWEDAVSR